MGAGAIGIGTGVFFGLAAKSKRDDSNAGHCQANDFCDPQGLSLRQDAISAATASTIAFAAGGLALAGGIALFVLAPKAAQNASIIVRPTPSGASALARIVF